MHSKNIALYIKYPLFLFLLISFISQTKAQLCEGSLGDAVVEIDFGSGSGRGDALGTAITAFTYSGSGELEEGEYTIANTTSGLKGNAWHVTTDHTGDSSGYMMVINSAVIASEGVFYTKTVSGLCANTTYEFSAWLINIMNPSIGTDQYHPDVTFRISDTSGTILGSYSTGDIAQTSSGTWLQYGLFFTLSEDTEVIITILNIGPSAHPGNDIALDDIAFRPCGPTITNSIVNEEGNSITVCQNEAVNYTFESSISAGYSNPQYQWQVSDDYGVSWLDITGATALQYLFTDTSISGTFLYRITAANGNNINTASCRIVSDTFTVEIIATPDALTGESEQSFCTTQYPTIGDIEVSTSAIWYDAAIGGNMLTDNTNVLDGNTYYAAQETNIGCESEDRIAILVSIVSPTLVLNDISRIVCDTFNDNEETIDLTIYESEITACSDCYFSYFTSVSDAQNYSEDGYILSPTDFNWDSDTSVVYVRVDSSDNCYQIAEIAITLGETPYIPIDDFVGICEEETYITIDAGAGFDSYLWSTENTSQTITVFNENLGNYSVTVMQDYGTYMCSTTKDFEVVLSNSAVISNIAIADWTDYDNTITITLSEESLGTYEYSLDNITYQDSNVFTRLTAGEYTVYIRDKNGCGITEEVVYILNYPKFFTPNNDGYNDTWSIPYSETEPTMTINIFDRYGKILFILDATSFWDGTYNGYNLPTSDYWFFATRADGRNHSGHFTLKR